MIKSIEINFPLSYYFANNDRLEFESQNEIQLYPGFWFIRGSNGSGKSTLISFLSLLDTNLDDKSRKKITYILNNCDNDDDNLTMAQLHEKKAKEIVDFRVNNFCYLSQKVFLLPGISIKDNARLFRDNRQNLPTDKYFNECSGGQKQKYYIDIMFQPEKSVWLLDEPLNNLDDANKKNCVEKIFDSNSDSTDKIVLFIEHDIDSMLNNNLDKNKIFGGKFVIKTKFFTKDNNKPNKPNKPNKIEIFKINDIQKFKALF